MLELTEKKGTTEGPGLGQEPGLGSGQGQDQGLGEDSTGMQVGIMLSLLSGWYGNVARYGGFFQRHRKRYIDRLMEGTLGRHCVVVSITIVTYCDCMTTPNPTIT